MKEWVAWAMLLCWCHAAGRCRPFSDRKVGTAAFSLSASHAQVTKRCRALCAIPGSLLSSLHGTVQSSLHCIGNGAVCDLLYLLKTQAGTG